MKQNRREFIKKAGWTFIGSGLYINLFTVGTSLARSSCSGIENLYAFIVNTETCIGCGKCVAACRTENHVPADNYRTWVERYTILNDGSVEVDSPHGGEQGYEPLDVKKAAIQKSFFVPKLCNHCKNPNCVQVCPVGATYVSPDGFVLVDEKRCVGCSYCMMACPYSARFMNPVTHAADKCTWCYHRIQQGKTTACVQVCPANARIFGRVDDHDGPVAQLLASKRLQVLKPETGNEPMVLYVGLDKEVR
jgi:Fe-S-cluster-containing dehydrogenase component